MPYKGELTNNGYKKRVTDIKIKLLEAEYSQGKINMQENPVA